jgi:ABC-type multidrug transport system fused ATPase/permease subunit
VLLDGVDVRQLSSTEVRRDVAVVPQDVTLFNDTFGYNVRYGRLDATDADVAAALRAARLDGLVGSWKDGLSTRVGERGLKLSGGEKQRVAIARAVLKDAPILFCDEATSALDAETEAHVMDDLVTVIHGDVPSFSFFWFVYIRILQRSNQQCTCKKSVIESLRNLYFLLAPVDDRFLRLLRPIVHR